MVTVEKLSIVNLVLYFVFYVVAHLIIGWQNKKIQRQFEGHPNDMELAEVAKNWDLIFKWFPGVYIVIVIFLMLML